MGPIQWPRQMRMNHHPAFFTKNCFLSLNGIRRYQQSNTKAGVLYSKNMPTE